MTSKTPNTSEASAPEILDDADLDQADGGIAMLLPAVQSAREAARRKPRKSAGLDFALTRDENS